MTQELLTVRRDGPVEYVTLNRPDVRNALNEHLIGDLTYWAERITTGGDVRCIVLAGAGAAFCAGADLAWMSKVASYSHEENVRDANSAAKMFSALDTLPVPLIGRIHGAALGGGAGLAALCDVAIAEEQTIFGFTEVKLGILPALISPYVLSKIGRSAARELFLTGKRFGAEDARRIGLVHTVAPAGRLDDLVAEYVNEILSAAPGAITTAKALIPNVWSRLAPDAIGVTVEALVASRMSEEGQEGMRAFLEKRKARWNVRPNPDRQSG
jgi:methylglutaconyl-CoA hydratase